MRLGDLDALKETINNVVDEEIRFEQAWAMGLKYSLKLIDNAPTVAVNCKACDGYEAGYSAGLKDAEKPQDEFTDLERKVIADSINYLLGAELLEENGYTEEVINALKSVLQKIGAEENHI